MALEPLESILGGTISRSLKNAAPEDGDFYDDEGLLVCGKCGKRKQIFIESPASDGEKIKVGVMCDCRIAQEKAEAERLKQEERLRSIRDLKMSSLMDQKFYESTFDKFQITKENARNHKLCIRYATGFEEMLQKNQGLLLWGGNGTGKTFAASCIANYLLDRQHTVVMTSLCKIMEYFDNRSPEIERIKAAMNVAELLILDDLGAERGTDYALEKIYGIIDGRCRTKRPVIFTTNLTLNEMLNENDARLKRIYDRIFEMCYPMQFTGVSWRRKAASARFEEMRAAFGKDVDDG